MKNLWISLPISLICLFANAATTPAPVATTAPTAAKAPTMTAPAPGAATTSAVNTSVAAAPAPAQPAATTTYGLTLGAEYDWGAEQQADGTRPQAMLYNIKPTLSHGDYTLKFDNYFEQDLVDTSANQANEWYDPALIVSRKSIQLSKYFKVGPSATLWLPLKDSSRNDVGMLYTVAAAASISLDTKALNMDAFGLTYQLQGYRLMTQYDTKAKSGNPNNAYKLRNRVIMTYQIMDKLSFMNLFDYSSTWSVYGNVTNQFFSLQTFGYDITDNLSVSVGHSNGGSVLKDKTYESNLKLYDPESSGYSVGLELNI